MATSLPPAPRSAAAEPIRCVRSHAVGFLAYGLALMALVAGLPFLAVRGAAPEVAAAIAAWTGAAAVVYAAAILSAHRTWLCTVIEATAEVLEVRRPHLRPERASLREIRRMAWGPLGLTVWLAGGRILWVGRLGRDAARLLARLEARSGVPIEGREIVVAGR